MNGLSRVATVSGGLVVAGALVAGGVASSALAASPRADDRSPVGGEHAHTHHIHTGNGDCVDIDQVRFEPGGHGLHHGVSQSDDRADMWHGTCDGKVYPGGPPLPPFVPHH